jgi:DNA-binding transcriptional MerR regulator
MAEEKIDLKKDIFSKPQYLKTIDTSFKELGVTTISQDLQSQIGVKEFFELYNSLFYDIPVEGERNSHTYLIEQSGDYVGFEERNEEIEALRAEIAELRNQLLASQVGNVTKELETLQDNSVDSELKNIQSQLGNITKEAADNVISPNEDVAANI